MSWGIVASVGASILGAKSQSNAAKKATKAQQQSADAQINFARESRDIELDRSQPYVDAGHSALRALMSLTGLGVPQTQAQTTGRGGIAEWPGRGDGVLGPDDPKLRIMQQDRGSIFARAMGGHTQADTLYNINEMGPENVYSKGKVRRSNMPVTIDGQTGYVQPNIEGRAAGGFFNDFDRPKRPQYTQPADNNAGYVQPLDTTAVNPATGYPNENPGGTEGGYNFQTDPGYQFRYAEGMRALERSAAARGGLLSGGFARKAIRYGQDYASNEYSNVYNRIASIAGIGQTSASQANNSSQFATGAINNATSDAGYARASGYTAQGNVWGNAASELGQIDWGNIFNRNTRPAVDFSGRPITYD